MSAQRTESQHSKSPRPKRPLPAPARWSVYMIRCRGGALYTGIAQNVRLRLAEHRKPHGKGAKFLRGKGPLRLVFHRELGAKGLALSVEARIKRLSKVQKEAMLKRSRLAAELIAEARGAFDLRQKTAPAERL